MKKKILDHWYELFCLLKPRRKAVQKLDGMDQVTVNLLTNSMQVSYDDKRYRRQILSTPLPMQDTVHPSMEGETLAPLLQKSHHGRYSPQRNGIHQKRLIWSVVFLIPVMYIAMHQMFNMYLGIPVPSIVATIFHGDANAITYAFTQFLLILPIMYINRKYYINGFKTLAHGAPNMDTLVGLGSMAAAVYGVFAIFRMSWGMGHGDWSLVATYSTNLYFESAGMIVTLIDIGKYLEALSKGKTSKAVERLMDLAPKEATVLRNGTEVVIPVEDLAIGDEIIVRPGENIPADGMITEGSTSIDESAITGESIPVENKSVTLLRQLRSIRRDLFILRPVASGKIRRSIKLSNSSTKLAPARHRLQN